MTRPLVVLAACALVLGCIGCSNAPACSVHCAGGSPCTGPIECASGVCLGGTCTTACDSSAHACAAGTYCLLVSHGAEGQGMECADHCGHAPDPVVTGDVACIGGVPVPCATAPTTACAQCLYVVNSHTFHCPDGTYCGGTTGTDSDCIPQHPQGDPCEANDECTSGNCSGASSPPAGAPPSVCEAAAGATCTTGGGECAYCEGGVCIQSCQAHAADCPISAPYCLGDATTNQFACRVACDGTAHCPTGYTCTTVDDMGRTVHACLPM